MMTLVLDLGLMQLCHSLDWISEYSGSEDEDRDDLEDEDL